MADAVPTLDVEANLAKMKAGFNGGKYFGAYNVAPAMTFEDGSTPELDKKLQAGPIEQPAISDPWVYRYPNSKMK